MFAASAVLQRLRPDVRDAALSHPALFAAAPAAAAAAALVRADLTGVFAAAVVLPTALNAFHATFRYAIKKRLSSLA